MSRPLRAALLLAVALPAAGCFTIRYERRAAPEAGAPRSEWHHGFVGGAIDGSGPVKLAEICPEGVARVESRTDFVNWLAQLLTSGGGLWILRAWLWEPQTVKVTCARPAATSGTALKVVVLPLTPLSGTSPEAVRVLSEALAGELRRRPGVSVIADSDVQALLAAEKRKELLGGCSDFGCLAEVGGAVGADRVVSGSVGRVGGSLVVNVSSLDPKKGRATSSVSERIKGGDEEAFLDALPALVDRLLAERPAR